ncbi:MarR family winged helix-turn-helix transcriptional regulator [Comamonas composti]|uniref:MarR family winged helix-turn-helix transcriptional regulator n=1 Tax=Comamonas composti TaxID=408558 RepID=UPI0006853310|nr:MarR family transcriptional regulator [Comamonas composti]
MTKDYKPPALEKLPGHRIRRLQQIAVALFMEETQELNLTPVQYVALSTVHLHEGLDQRRLALHIGFDTSTVASMLNRLESRGLIERKSNPRDRRVRQLSLTAEGLRVLIQAGPGVLRAQERMLAPLGPGKRTQFMELMDILIGANDELARAPSIHTLRALSIGPCGPFGGQAA